MKKNGAPIACFVMVIFCGSIFSKAYTHNFPLKSTRSMIGLANPGIEQLVPGEPKAGTLPAVNPGSRLLSETQYAIQYPGGGTKLELEFHPDYPVNFYVRRNLPVTMEDGKVVYDLGPIMAQKVSLPDSPPLDAATYFIAVENYSSRVVGFTLTATVVDAPTADTVDLGFPSVRPDKLELGSIPMPEPNGCVLGATQYTISVADSVYCEFGSGWLVTLQGDQKLNLYVRLGQRVAVEDGKVVADFESKPTTGNGTFSVFGSVTSTAMMRTYYIAVENCNPNTVNYSLLFGPRVPDLPSPSIQSAFLANKNLQVMGYSLDPASIVLIDGEPQKTKYGGRLPVSGFPLDQFIVKKVRKKVNGGENVMISIKLPSGCTTRPFQYVRPTD